jgi:hypothetical protein
VREDYMKKFTMDLPVWNQKPLVYEKVSNDLKYFITVCDFILIKINETFYYKSAKKNSIICSWYILFWVQKSLQKFKVPGLEFKVHEENLKLTAGSQTIYATNHICLFWAVLCQYKLKDRTWQGYS